MPATPPWPSDLDDLWAKSATPGMAEGESLAQHTWRVLERLGDLARIRPGLAEQLGEPRLWHRLYWACFFHDLGKAAPGFQDRLRGRKDTPVGRQWGQNRHEVLSLAFVAWAFPPTRRGEESDAAVRDDRRWITAAVASHHRDAAEINSLYPPEADELFAEVLVTLPAETIEGIYRWLDACGLAWATRLELPGVEPLVLPTASDAVRVVREEGARRTRGLLREYQRWATELDERAGTATAELILRGSILQADHTASAHTDRLVPLRISTDALYRTWNLASTYPHQDQCATTDDSAVLIAPTGSGKTEAALLWGARQAQLDDQLPRLFYSLPYQASMNAMYRRLNETFTQKQVGLQHGRSLLALYRRAMETEENPVSAERQARWRANLARLNYYPVRVFSPYQMLKALYRLKGYEAMLLDYHGASFVFDEIHAYAPERLGLILALVEHLRMEFRSRFLVMTATFPSIVRRHLADAIGPHTVVEASPETYRAFQRHRIQILDGDLLEQLDLPATRARLGGSVLVCCNTVQRAQDAWRSLSTLLPGIEVVLLHGRFNGRDRITREELIREATGARSRSRRPIVLVATQVVEVSLDIDLDTIYSDPAPLEALVQRFGRVNRRRQQTSLAPVHVFREPADGQGIYDEGLVRASLAALASADGEPLDESRVGRWLDAIYAADVADAWETVFSRARRDGRQILQTLRPFQSDESLADQFDAAFDSVEVVPSNLLAEYQQLQEDDPILASSLLVPISDRRRRQLWRAGLVRPNTRPPVVDVAYQPDVGLDFSSVAGPAAEQE